MTDAAAPPRADPSPSRAPYARVLLPLLWALLPFLAGPAFAEALDPRVRAVQVVASVGLWAAWVVALAAALVPRTTSLTIVRIIIPASVLAAAWAAFATPSFGVSDVLALASSAVATIVVL